MASYPTAVKSFTTKNAGQTVQSAHVNDLQDEVSAVESGLLTGLQHGLTISTGGLSVSTGSVNLGGPSSLATLQVNGASTFVGPVTFSTGVTFHASQAFTRDAVRVTGSTTVLEHNTTRAIAWPTQVYALNSSLHSTGTNPERFTPQSTGLYLLHASVQMNDWKVSTAVLTLDIEDSSGGLVARAEAAPTTNASAIFVVEGTKYVPTVAATPWVRLVGKQTQGSSNGVFAATSWADFRKL